MRHSIRTAIGLTVAAAVGATLALPTGGTASAASPAAPVHESLADQLDRLSLSGRTTVLVHGRTLADAERAVEAPGLKEMTRFDKIGVVVARGTKRQVLAAGSQSGVTCLEGNQPIEFSQYTSNTSTRGTEAWTTLTGADGTALSGKGVSVGVIDSGVDPDHPYLQDEDGSAVVRSLKVLCDPLEVLCHVTDTGRLAAEVESALKSTAHKHTFGAPYEQADGFTTSYDKGAGLVDVVAAVQALRG